MADRKDPRSTLADEVEPGATKRPSLDNYDGPAVEEPPDDAAEQLDSATEELVDRALERFRDLTAHAVELITDDALSLRLQQVKHGTPPWFDRPHSDSEELAGSVYNIVNLWIRIIMAILHVGLGPDDRDIDEITTETIAQGMNRFNDQPAQDNRARKVAFLAACAARLPHAYLHGWLQFRAGSVEVHDLHEVEELSAVAAGLTDGLYRCVDDQRDRVAEIMKSWGHSEEEVAEILSVTREATLLAHDTTG